MFQANPLNGGANPPPLSKVFEMQWDFNEEYKRALKPIDGEPNIVPYNLQMLWGPMRKYVIDKVKKPLMKAIIEFSKCGSWLGMLIALIQIVRTAKRYPEPTRGNCRDPNVHRLLDIEDEFFEREDNPSRKDLFKALFRIFIAEYAHDPYYKFRVDWLKERLCKSNWEQPSSWVSIRWKAK